MQAEKDGIDLNVFRLAGYGIPYGFTPVLVAEQGTLRCVLLPFLTFHSLQDQYMLYLATHRLRTLSNVDGTMCMASNACSMTGSTCSSAESAAAP